jgi:serine protease
MPIATRRIAIVVALFACAWGLAPASTSSATTTSPMPTAHKPRLYPTVQGAAAQRASISARSGSALVNASPTQPQLVYGGGRDGIGVTLAPKVYVVFWGSQWGTANPAGSTNFSGDPKGVATRIIDLMSGIGTNNEEWSGVMTQYCEGVPTGSDFCAGEVPHVGYPDGGPLAGWWADTAAPISASPTQTQLGNEAISAAAHFGNTDAASNRNAQYVIVSPTGTHPDGFNAGGGFCAWHDFTTDLGVTSPYGDIALTNMPYVPDMGASCGANFVNTGTAGDLDGVTMVEGHEYAETLTDQNPAGGWTDVRGLENADKCAWLATGVGRAQNVTFATGTFAMHGTWSNADRSCEIADPIWGRPDGPDDFAISASPHSAFMQPGDTANTTILSARTSGIGQTVQLSVSGGPPDSTVQLSTDSIATDDSATLTVATASTTPFGTYPITVTAQGSTTHTAVYTVAVGAPPQQLQPSVALTGLSGAAGTDQYFYITLPWEVVDDFTIGGGTGNADLYVSAGTLPTDDNYQCASQNETGPDTCIYFHPSGATFYVRVHATTDFSGLSLQASPVPIFMQPQKGFPVTFSGTAGQVTFAFFRYPPGTRKLTLQVSGHGDVDLYVRRNALPTPFANDRASAHPGHHREKCIFTSVYGSLYIGIYAKTDFTAKLSGRPSTR